MKAPRIALISLEPWDDVWRRNQHLVTELVRQGAVRHVDFIEPPRFGRASSHSPLTGVQVLRPALQWPKRGGGLWLLGARLRRGLLGAADVLWVNDPTLGVHCLSPNQPALYDVTDDWREFGFPPRIVRRIVRAEDRLAPRASTVVCSSVLAERWRSRYGVEAAVVTNGVDAAAWRDARPVQLPGAPPHVGYIGTLHDDRLDIDLLVELADALTPGTVHLVGPEALSAETRKRLAVKGNVRLHGPVAHHEVPGYTLALDVLVSPHRVTPFTLSLDAIKSREYLASGRPVVATPTSGFQSLQAAQLDVVDGRDFAEAVTARLIDGRAPRTAWTPVFTWEDAAAAMNDIVRRTLHEPSKALAGT